MKGCILFGRFVWSTEAKNRPQRQARPAVPARAGEKSSDGGKA